MSKLCLVIGNKNYSSWSLRPWLAMKVTGIEFEEDLIPLYRQETAESLIERSPSGKVPVLVHGDVHIWDSLAIIEYLAETFPEAGLWPEDAKHRAVARSVAAEMHSGFTALRNNMHMNVRKSLPGKGRGEGVDADIARILRIWHDCRGWHAGSGPFLFGRFSAADAMFAPVVSRFETYGVEVDATARAYMDTIFALPAMREWIEAGKAEPWVIEFEEL